MLQRLKQKDIGCHIGASFTGALCYADDLSLLCPTTRGPQKMISVCSEFAEEYIVVLIRPICPDIYLYLNGEKLECTDTFKHLGNIITTDQKDDSDIQLKCGHFYRSVTGLCCKFKCVLLNNDVAERPFPAYCCSVYGSQIWNLSNSIFEYICTAWNKAVRRIFNLLHYTHRYLLPYIVQTHQKSAGGQVQGFLNNLYVE